SRADAVVAVSRHLAGEVVALGIDARRVSVVYNGIDKGLFNAGVAEAPREEAGNGPMVLYVGNPLPVKGLDVLIQACEGVGRRWIGGGGGCRSAGRRNRGGTFAGARSDFAGI